MKTEKNEVSILDPKQIILIMENWILRIGSEKELTKENWYYRKTDSSGVYTLIDYDNSSLQPLVKTVLNEVMDFPEIKLLKMVRFFQIVAILLMIIGVWLMFSRPDKEFVQWNTDKIIESIVWRKEVVTKWLFQALPKEVTGNGISSTKEPIIKK